MGATGLVERYKARFVVKVFCSDLGLISQMSIHQSHLRLVLEFLSAITHRKMLVRQLDIKTAFLNGELDPNLYLYCHQPEGFRVLGPDGSHLVCKLVKSLYGLKQAPRAWSQMVKEVLTAHGFVMSRAEPA